MFRKLWLPLALLLGVAIGLVADEVKLSVGPDDTIRNVLAAQTGKTVTVRVDGEEMTGIVRSVNAHTVHLGQLSGKEFYDAVVNLDEVSAVVVRVK
jgi:hypothetical protein